MNGASTVTPTQPSPPRWIAWIDTFALGCLLVGVGIALSPGRVRLEVAGTTLSLGSAWRPLCAGLLLIGVRHWRQRKPHLGERLASSLGRPTDHAVVLSLRMLVVTRLPVLAAGCAATLLIGLAPDVRPISRDPFRNLPLRWDATWYVEIARVGYHDPRRPAGGQQPIVFFPVYPMMMRTLGAFTTPERTASMSYEEYLELRRVRLAWSGLVISLLAFAGALVVVYRWAESRAGAEAAAATVVLLSTYPFAVFYSAPYTESVFLLLTAGACYAFEKGRLPVAAAAALLAGLTRPNGMMLSVPLAVLSLGEIHSREPGWIKRLIPRVLVAAMPVAGTLIYTGFIKTLTGDPFAWIRAQAAWGRRGDATILQYQWAFRTVQDEGILAYVRAVPAEAFQLVAVVFAFALVWPVWRRVGAAYALFILANLVPPLIQGGLLSLGRFTATLFPLFLALAVLVPAERRGNWVIVFSIAQGLIAAVFFSWRAIY